MLPNITNIKLSDILDILIIAIGLYSVFLLFKKTKTYLILFGSIIFVGLYLSAKFFNLVLTLQIMQYFAGVSILFFAVIFQREIRKYFELLGLFGTRQIPVTTLLARSPGTTEIIQTCIKMAKTKTGALIVIKGNDPIEHLTEGGVQVDGLISEEILLSIFDDHSDGHDGAVIIENNRIARLGVHLPLSNNFKEIGKHGTRHSAALGLVESCDAICIVVSEEKGTISIFRSSKKKTLEEYDDLEKELTKFIKEKFTKPEKNIFFQTLFSDWGLKTAALATSSLLWFFIVYRAGIIQKTYQVPVNFTTPPADVLVKSFEPKTVDVTLSGRSESNFASVATDSIKLIVDSKTLKDGVNKIDLSPDSFKLPKNLDLAGLSPISILLTTNRYQLYTIPLAVKTKGTPFSDFSLKKTTITPETLDVLIPEGEKVPKEILTETIDITDQKESLVVPVKPILSDTYKQKDEPSISVALTIEK